MWWKKALPIACIALALPGGGCRSPAPPKTITIDQVGWVIENIDPLYWTGSPPAGTCFISFWVHWPQYNITETDVESATMSAPTGTRWTFAGDQAPPFVSTSGQTFGGWIRLRDTGDEHRIPLGIWSFDLELVDGGYTTATLDVPDPGSTVVSHSFACTEDFGPPGPGDIAMPPRATLTQADLYTATETATFSFTFTSSVVFGGWAWFFDSAGGYVGASQYFVDPSTSTVASFVNSGSGIFHSDGTSNAVVLGPGTIAYAEGTSFSSIATVVVVLIDGSQYSAISRGYDCRSLSARETLVVH